MVLVELFDQYSPIDNLIGGLMFQTEHIVFLGPDRARFLKHAERHQRIYARHGLSIKQEFILVPPDDADAAAETFAQLIERFPGRCAFDLSGGEEIGLVAAGMIQERYHGTAIPMYFLDPLTRTASPICGTLPPFREKAPTLTVEENILLHGGYIVDRSERPEGTYHWDWTAEFCADFDTMWELCKMSFPRWNGLAQLFSVLPLCENQVSEPLRFQVDMKEYLTAMRKEIHFRQFNPYLPLVNALRDAGLLTEYHQDDEIFRVGFKNEQIFECMTKAGTLWELKTWLETARLTDNNGNPYYHSCMTGVLIEWDSALHDMEETEETVTQNEVDVLAMRGVVPVFISCKSGNYDADELYKLSIVALRFGGRYGKRALFASQVRHDRSISYLRSRAEDMKIQLEEGCIEEAQMQECLRSLIP